MNTSRALSPEHAEHLARFRIPADMLEAVRVRSVIDSEGRNLLGLNCYQGADLGGILFTYLSPLTGDRTGGRIRLDNPLQDGKKYVSEPGCGHFFFAPCPPQWLADTSIPVIFVESEKAALAVKALADRVERPMVVIAIGGCWGWRRKIGNRNLPNGGNKPETGPSRDFDLVVWQGRTVFVVFDSNISSNPSVQRSCDALARELARRRALVQVAEVPAVESVNGPDDLIAVCGDDAMLRVLDAARPSLIITLQPGKQPFAVDQAEEILLSHSERLMIFQRAGELVRAFFLPEPREGAGLRRSRETMQLEPLSGTALTEIFDRNVAWQRISPNGDRRFVDCPPRISAAYLSRTGSWLLPVLNGIIFAPIMRGDGTILCQPGYDHNTGLLFISDTDWPPIPDRPTHTDAEAALRDLKAPFKEFPFVGDADLATHIASMLTASQRRLLGACPLFGYSAPAPRSGKTLLAESTAIVATGKPAPATTISGEREEMRKVITSVLREGHAVINLDNLERPLSSPELCIAITQPEYQDRVLGESRMLRLPTDVLWTATGNNLVFRGDLSSRALLCRLDSGLECPESRKFVIPQLSDYLRRNRRQLVVAGLTIIRAYHGAGYPRQIVTPWGGFDDWSLKIREALVWAGLADPCETRAAVLSDNPEREEWFAGLRILRNLFTANEFTTKEIIDGCGSNDDLKNSMLSLAAGRQHRNDIDPRRLGWWLKRVRDRIIGGLRLHLSRLASGVAHWRIEEVLGGGYRGHGGHFPVAETTSQPAKHPNVLAARRPENDHADHHDRQEGDDLRQSDDGPPGLFDGPNSDEEIVI